MRSRPQAFHTAGPAATHSVQRVFGMGSTPLRRQVRDQALAAERAGTARYRAQLGAEAAALEARLESDWQRRAAAEAARLEGQRAAAGADARAAKVWLEWLQLLAAVHACCESPGFVQKAPIRRSGVHRLS